MSSRDGELSKAIALSNTPVGKRGMPTMLIAMAAVSIFWGLVVLALCGLTAILAALLYSHGHRAAGIYIVLGIRCAILLLVGLSILAGGVLLVTRRSVGFYFVLLPCYFIMLGTLLGFLGSFCSAVGATLKNTGMRNGILAADLVILLVVFLVTGFLHYAHRDDKIYRWLRG